MRFRLAPLALTLSFCMVAFGWSPGARADTDLYPTDRCVADKLEAAAKYCSFSVGAVGNPGLAAALEDARTTLAEAWAAAEEASAEAGVSCEQTTVSAAEMIALLDGGAGEIASEVSGSRACLSRRLQSAGRVCRDLLRAESEHLLTRSEDREREALAQRRAEVLANLDQTWNLGCPVATPPADAIQGLVESARLASVVSPHVSTSFTMITPPTAVPYKDTVLDPRCSNNTPWVYFVRRGTVNKLLVYYQGGGACWDYLTCGLVGTHKRTAGAGDNPANATTGFADMTNPENPFRDWHVVFVPYCTGDVHWGDAIVTHQLGFLSTTIRHKGRVNAAVAEKFAREHFVDPDEVFVSGSSAGSYGAVLNGVYLMEDVYPSSVFSVLGDGGNGVITQDFQENHLPKWGVEDTLPRWIPALDVPLAELSAADLFTEAALFYPTSRVATYTTAYDGGSGGQVGFYHIMLSGTNFLQWPLWWTPSCQWNQIMREMSLESVARAPNFRYYIDAGSRHTMWGTNRVYTDTTGVVPTVVSWVNAMVSESDAEWTNVECADCGLVFPGDPRPSPLQAPYFLDADTGETRIICED
jgi:hypothetical protein